MPETDSGVVTNSALLSPNGKRIAVSKGVGIYVMDSDGKNERELLSTMAPPENPGTSQDYSQIAWSPDSSQIALVYIEYGNKDNKHWIPKSALILIPVDGSKKATPVKFDNPVTFDVNNDHPLSWSPDGNHIIARGYLSADVPEHPSPILLDLDVAKKHVEQFMPGHNYNYAAWSPDGKQLVAEEYQADAQTKEHLTIMNADGSNPQSVPFPDNTYISSFVWSPDNTQIAFVADTYEVKDNVGGYTKHLIDTINADGTNLQTLVDLGDAPAQLVTVLSWGVLP